ncbi:hypothetical protein OQH61_08760 [Helicobacter sp. MIT 21-1697]|uniref:hypothetical protein n=1 Tax=Helicobacter sp. MIT 21-1697 TaxID=2993733 RepID=UPI00224B8408|nr:hypothetical protein [Helicobacter sp. MIT 21-1697]MCX2717821.1 hypothetical protein [Helicobacter sp. MIT 21-1697]
MALGFNLCLEFNVGGMSVFRHINYAILKDFCLVYGFDSLELLGLYKEMIVEMEAI